MINRKSVIKILIDRQNQIVSPTPTPQEMKVETPITTVIPTPDLYLESLNKLSESDEIASIEADLNSTDITQLEGDLEELEASINL